MNKNSKVKSASPLKKLDITTIRKKTVGVERELHSLEHVWKLPTKIKGINKWQRAVEERIDYLTNTLYEINNVVKNNLDNIVEIKTTLRHNYENIKTIFDILTHQFKKDKKDKRKIYKAFKKKFAS